MSRIGFDCVLGTCSVSIPKIRDSERTSSNLSGTLRIGTIPTGASTFELTKNCGSSSYYDGYGGNSSFTFSTRFSVPALGGSTYQKWESAPGNTLYCGNPSSPSDSNKNVRFWHFINNNGYLEVFTYYTSYHDNNTSIIFLNVANIAPVNVSITIKFYG